VTRLKPARLAVWAASGALLCGVLVVVVLIATRGGAAGPMPCAYANETRGGFARFEAVVGRRINCAMVFADAAPDWRSWEYPWFVYNRIPNENWTSFARRSGNTLIITVNLFPSSVRDGNWRAIGASGGYAAYAKVLARNLVAAGMGHAIIRLGHEANGTWYADNVGTTPTQWAQWRQFWRRTAIAMRSVPGADFNFNWCIAAGTRPIPFSAYYPGNDVVDSIGVDIYDSGVPRGVTNRWGYQYERPGGVGAIARFAQAEHKPLSVPEWGLQPTSADGVGSDPAFTRGIVDLIRSRHVSFQSYFFAEGGRSALLADPASLRIYRKELLH
jgi:hypothetical protein